MAQLRIRTEINVWGLARGQEVTVEESQLIRGGIRSGIVTLLEVIADVEAPAPVAEAPRAPAKAPRAKRR